VGQVGADRRQGEAQPPGDRRRVETLRQRQRDAGLSPRQAEQLAQFLLGKAQGRIQVRDPDDNRRRVRQRRGAIAAHRANEQ
jgi:hypothetical protein